MRGAVLPDPPLPPQVDLVCHGKTEVVPDRDGSDPYQVSCAAREVAACEVSQPPNVPRPHDGHPGANRQSSGALAAAGRLLTGGSDGTVPGLSGDHPPGPGSWAVSSGCRGGSSSPPPPPSPAPRSPREGASSVRSTVETTLPRTSSSSASSRTGRTGAGGVWGRGGVRGPPRPRRAHSSPWPGPQARVRGPEPEEGGQGAGVPGGPAPARGASREGERL